MVSKKFYQDWNKSVDILEYNIVKVLLVTEVEAHQGQVLLCLGQTCQGSCEYNKPKREEKDT